MLHPEIKHAEKRKTTNQKRTRRKKKSTKREEEQNPSLKLRTKGRVLFFTLWFLPFE
jgi:hypothetical protein